MIKLTRLKWPVLLALLAGAGALALFGDKRPADLAQPLREANPTARVGNAPSPPGLPRNPVEPTRAAETLRPVLDRSTIAAPRHAAGNPFTLRLAPPPPAAPLLMPARTPVATVPPAPPAPPFVYQGKQWADQRWLVFLGRDEQTYIVQEGSTIERNYRVERIAPPTLTLTDLARQQSLSIAIGDDK